MKFISNVKHLNLSLLISLLMPPEPIARPNLPTTEEMKKIIFPKLGIPTSAKPIFPRLIPLSWPTIQFQTTPSKLAQPKSHCLPILRETWSYRTYMLSNTPSNTYAQPHLHSTISSFQLACWLCYLASCHYRLECSVHASRRHHHIVETRLTLLHNASLPLSFWSFAFQIASYLINRLPTSLLNNKSSFESLFGSPPNYSKLRIFGCLCFPWLKPYTSLLTPHFATINFTFLHFSA